MDNKLNFKELMETKSYNDMRSPLVYDNAGGNASEVCNKTSVWLGSGRVLLRLCNISTTNVDGVDEIGLFLKDYEAKGILHSVMLPLMMCKAFPKEANMYMNPVMFHAITHSKLIQVKDGEYYYMDVHCNIDSSIKNNEKPIF